MKRTFDTLTTVVVVLICLSAYLLIDWIAGWLSYILPDGLQYFLMLVGVIVLMFSWIGRALNWMERDLDRIQRKERATKVHALKSQTGQARISEPNGNGQ